MIFDTGTSLAIFPSELAKKINTELGFSPVFGNANHYSISCAKLSTLPNLTLELETGKILLTPNEYIYKSGTSECKSGITGGSPTENLIIFGNVLMRRFYMVFDFKAYKVGIAVANRSPIDANKPTIVYADSTNSPLGTWENQREIYQPGSNLTQSKFKSSSFNREILKHYWLIATLAAYSII